MSVSDDSDYNVPLSQSKHHQKLNERSKHTSIAHLNIQAMLTFYEFVMMLQECQFDIIALSETWLQDCLVQQNYVQVNGFNSVFRNRISKREGCVGFYMKESITYKVRHDLSKGHDNLEILFVQIGRRSKNTPSLICVVHQPSSNEIEKMEWLQNFENLLADVYLKWRYLLHTFSLHQHITKAARINKTVIDHISSNMNKKLLHTEVFNDQWNFRSQHSLLGIFDIKKERYEPRYKYVRNEKDFNTNDYVADFKLLPTSIVFGFDDANDEIAMS